MFQSLLDESIPIDIDLLDQCVQNMYQTGQDQYNTICNSFKERSDSFSIVEEVLQSEHSFYLKIYSLTIFSNFIQYKWETIPAENQIELRDFISQFINNITSTPSETLSRENRQILARYANLVLLNILKYDWPDNWPNFIPDILEASNSSPDMCANTFVLLQSLAQEFTEFTDLTESSINSNRQGEMNSTFIAQFPLIIPVMEMALTSTENPDLVNSVLTSLKYFIKAIDPTIIFNSKIFSTICDTLLPDNQYTINCIAVIGEIAANRCLQTDISSIILHLFQSIVECLSNFFPVQLEITGNEEQPINLYQVEVPNPQDFIHIFITSMTSFISSYQNILENQENSEAYSIMLKWLFNVTTNTDSDSNDFLFCIQLWHSISRSIYTECVVLSQPYSEVYPVLLYHLRRFAIRRMACPKEVIYIVDNTGIHSRRENIKSQTTNLYICMREMLVYLTHIDHEDMMTALFEKIEEIKESETFSMNQMSSFCWAAGSLGSGALTEEEESQFFTTILEYLLQLFKSLSDVMIRASVASGIMYVCSQYGRFLMNYWELLKVVMDKLFEFMNEMEFQLVQDSAVESMKALVKRRSNLLITKQDGEDSSYLEMMLNHASEILTTLSLDNVVEMYEIFSILIQQLENDQEREEMTSIISNSLNGEENGLISLSTDIQPFDQNWLDQFTLIIKCNKKMVKFLGYTFYGQLKKIIPILLQIYSTVSEGIQGEIDPDSNNFIIIMNIKSIIVKLFTTSVRMCGKTQFIIDTVLPPSIEILMPEYSEASVFKTPEILSLFANLSMKLHNEIMKYIDQIFQLLIHPTLQYLTDYSTNFPYWKNFIILILALVQIPTLMTSLPNEEIDVFMQSLKLCCGHPQIEISEKGLQALMDLLSVLETRTTVQFFNDFIAFYGLDLMQFVMGLLTDSVHRFAFNLLIGLSKRLISLSQIKSKEADLFQIFTEMFPNRPANEMSELIEKMIQLSSSYLDYKLIMKNFLINASKFAVNDPALYKKEKEEIIEQIKKKAEVPGLLQSSESPEVQGNVQKLVDKILNFNLFI